MKCIAWCPPSPTCGNQTTWGHVISSSESCTHPQWSLAAAGRLSVLGNVYVGKITGLTWSDAVWRRNDKKMEYVSVFLCEHVSPLPCNIPVDERALRYSCNLLLFVEFCSFAHLCLCIIFRGHFARTDGGRRCGWTGAGWRCTLTRLYVLFCYLPMSPLTAFWLYCGCSWGCCLCHLMPTSCRRTVCTHNAGCRTQVH